MGEVRQEREDEVQESQNNCCDILSPRKTPYKGPRFVCCNSGSSTSLVASPFSTPPHITRGTAGSPSTEIQGAMSKTILASPGKTGSVLVRVVPTSAFSEAKLEVPPERTASTTHSECGGFREESTFKEAFFETYPASREGTNITLHSPTTRVIVARGASPAPAGSVRFRLETGSIPASPAQVPPERLGLGSSQQLGGSRQRSESPSFPPSKDTLTELRNQTMSEMEIRRQSARESSPRPGCGDSPSSPMPSCRFRQVRGDDQPLIQDTEVPAYLASARMAVADHRPAGAAAAKRASSFDSVWSSLRAAPGSRFVELISMASLRMQELRNHQEPELQQQLQLQLQEEQQQRLQEQQLQRRQQLLEQQELLRESSIAYLTPSPFPATRTASASPGHQRRRASIPRWGSISAQKANSPIENLIQSERFWPLATSEEARSMVYAQPDLAPAAAAAPATENMRRLVSCGSMGKMVTMNSSRGVTRTSSDFGKRAASPRRSLSTSNSGRLSVDSSRPGSQGLGATPRSSLSQSSLLRRVSTTPIVASQQAPTSADPAPSSADAANASANNSSSNNGNGNVSNVDDSNVSSSQAASLSNSNSYGQSYRNNSHSSSGYSNGLAAPSSAPTALGPPGRMSATTTGTSVTTVAPASMSPNSSGALPGVSTPRTVRAPLEGQFSQKTQRPTKSAPSSPKKMGTLDGVMRAATATTGVTSPKGTNGSTSPASPRSFQPGKFPRRPLSANRTGGAQSARQPVPNAGTISLF